MRGLLVLALALAALLLLFLWWFLRTPPERVARALRRSALLLVVASVILLAATGRLHWIFAVIGAMAPLALRIVRLLQAIPLPILQRLISGLRRPRTQPRDGGQQSQVGTRFLRMTLDHDTGEMGGVVVEGRFKGRMLADMTLEDLLDLLDECRADAQSAVVLEAYLERTHPDWRDVADSRAGDGYKATGNTDDMTEREAREILGVGPDATSDDIVAAHRRLMQKVHPDHGGSDYLAAQINRAKAVLLDASG